MLQPNFLATHYKTHYERIRDEQVKRNNEVLESLGVMKIATSMMGSARHQCANDNGKRGRADQVDDPDYMLSNDENGHGYNSESDDSFEQEDMEIPPGGLPAQSHTEPQCGATLISERVTRSTPHPSMESQASLPPIAQPQNEVLPPIAQPQNEVLPENNGGKHAAQLASRIGVEVRTHVIGVGVPRWKALDESVKGPILQRIMDKFDLQGDPIDVEKAVATQCGRRLSSHNFVLHKKYKKLKETRGEEYARNNPPIGVNPEQWTSLVTKKWTIPKWLEQSGKNASNRFDFLPFSNAAFAAAFLPSFLPLCPWHLLSNITNNITAVYGLQLTWSKTKHRCGSKSLPVRVAAADKMVQIEIEHNAQEGAIPITQEELSVKGLKAKLGYVKGLGIRPSSSIRTVNREYVTHLEGKVQEQAEKIQEQAEGIEAANNKIEEQGKTLASVMAFLKQQGFTG
ncbi:hypothetical protein RHGRI_030918 [Rhododendron griersonianum]|uniref:Uncharacterized protein n=1 Tax=Rhododendron griersonianum TaxID=479676 RepID=A0AAV6I6F0_9ERIC|nr:hypothetical protein RHGRI_030918 [Rhododendron griersonianum]